MLNERDKACILIQTLDGDIVWAPFSGLNITTTLYDLTIEHKVNGYTPMFQQLKFGTPFNLSEEEVMELFEGTKNE